MYRNVHAIGDSHVLHMGGLFNAYHICDEELQGATAHNLIEPESSTDSNRRIRAIMEQIPDGDTVIMCFGEVDCRLHITSREMVDATVARYTQFLNGIAHKLVVHEVIGAVPQDNSHRVPGYLPQAERGKLVKHFNALLAEWCLANGATFLRVGASDNGVLRDSWTDDQVHLNSRGIGAYREFAEKMGFEKIADVVYTSRAMLPFGKRIAELLGLPLFVETPVGDVDRVFVVGMYDPPYYGTTLRCIARAKHKHIHWCGTDVMLLTHPELLPAATHSADGEHLAKELFDKGICARVALSPALPITDIAPLPSEPIVAVYFGADGRKYGASTIAAVMEAMPEYRFITYHYGQFAPEQMSQVISECTAALRLTRHDGGACGVREFMAGGRRVVATVDLPYVKRVRPDDLTGICSALRRAHMSNEPDYDAAAYYQALNAPEAFIEAIEGWGTWQR